MDLVNFKDYTEKELEDIRAKLYRDSYYLANKEKIQEYQKVYNLYFKKNKLGLIKGKPIYGYKKTELKNSIVLDWS